MPAHERSLHITDAYRRRMVSLRGIAERAARQTWARVHSDDLDATYDPLSLAAAITQIQRAGTRASAGYLTAFVGTELGKRQPSSMVEVPVGIARDGRPLADALASPLIGVKTKIGEGIPVADAMNFGRNRLLRMVGLASDDATRRALTAAMEASPHIEGWRRAVSGTCDACLGLATDSHAPPGTPLEIHPGCECVSEPVVASVPNRFPRPTGAQLFAAMGEVRQNELFGPDRAKLIRDGDVALHETVDRSPQELGDDFVTSKPLDQLAAAKAGEGGRDGRGDHHHD